MPVETLPYLAGVARMIRAAGRRVGEADEFELAELLAMQQVFDDAVQAAVDGQRATGRSWAAIATAAGTSRQACQQRWGGTRSGGVAVESSGGD